MINGGGVIIDFVAMVFGMPLALFPALSDALGGPSLLGLLYAAPPSVRSLPVSRAAGHHGSIVTASP